MALPYERHLTVNGIISKWSFSPIFQSRFLWPPLIFNLRKPNLFAQDPSPRSNAQRSLTADSPRASSNGRTVTTQRVPEGGVRTSRDAGAEREGRISPNGQGSER